MSASANISTEPTKATTLKPAFTTRQDETGVHLQVALPGVRKEDLKLTLNQSVLQLEATRSNAVPEEWKTHSGYTEDVVYTLHVRLTSKLDGSNAKAALDNGVLTLDIPLHEEAKPREIYVN